MLVSSREPMRTHLLSFAVLALAASVHAAPMSSTEDGSDSASGQRPGQEHITAVVSATPTASTERERDLESRIADLQRKLDELRAHEADQGPSLGGPASWQLWP